DPVAAGHAALALGGYRRHLEALGSDVVVPPAFIELLATILFVARSGQTRAVTVVGTDDGDVALLHVGGAAGPPRGSPRTARPRIADGSLPAVRVGRRV